MLARDNPFASDRVLSVRFRPQSTNWNDILERLESTRYRAAILGPEGSGKTTLLEDLEPRLQDRGFRTHWLRLSVQDRRPASGFWRYDFGPGEVLLFDGAEVLPNWLWWRVLHHTRRSGLLVTVHRPCSLPILVETTTSPQLLNELVGELGQSIPDADSLLKSCRGNVREAFRQLYLRAAEDREE